MPSPHPTCFDCRFSEIDPGCPGCHTLSNGDPGYPDEPPEAICMDPLAFAMSEEFDYMLSHIEQSIYSEVYRNTLELNRGDGEFTTMPYRVKQKMVYDLRPLYPDDFARYCPMFHPRMIDACQQCGKPINAPKHSWKLWACGMYDSYPVCSEECKEKARKETEEWF